mmetsp:Transcript_43662/g.86117  ORF Transcript_43662/g.86117 Transcript_43662/m.86117 type:complete len:469 (-) Transcript_43662:139-1545(-)
MSGGLKKDENFTDDVIYEYIPDSNAKGKGGRDAGGDKDKEKEKQGEKAQGPLPPGKEGVDTSQPSLQRSFETFKNKTYRTAGGMDLEKGFVIGSKLRLLRRRSVFECVGQTDLPIEKNETKEGGGERAQSSSPPKARRAALQASRVGVLSNFETPLQRLSRLQNEVSDLIDFLDTNRDLGNDLSRHVGGSDADAVRQEVKGLREGINALMADERLKDEVPNVNAVTGQRSVASTLLSKVDALVAGGKSKEAASKPAKDGGASSDSITYELFYEPSAKQTLDASRLISLEGRLAELEQQIGHDAVGKLPFADLQSGISEVAERMVLLDATKLDAVGRRVQALLTETEALLQRKKEMDEAGLLLSNSGLTGDQEKKIAEMFEICHRWQSATSALPIIVDRLKSLKGVHQQAGAFASRLQILEKQQLELGSMMSSTSQSLAAIKESVASNLLKMKENVASLDKRMAAVGLK